MGVVYEAFDTEQNARIAIKTLRAVSHEDASRLKREFRALQDLRHPNLVTLGELIEEGGTLFFTMELVVGCHFLEYVRPTNRGLLADPELRDQSGVQRPVYETMRVPEVGALTLSRDIVPQQERVRVVDVGGPVSECAETVAMPPLRDLPPAMFHEDRLRSSLAQLTSALIAVHQSGKVHRDVKPSNVLVTADGRLVMLDLGLVTDLQHQTGITERAVVGTAAYMSPEQAASKPVGPESDWYSVGVMLYEALTGELPHDGPALKMLIDKQREEPAPPSQRVCGVPRDLEQLCLELLRYEPSSRPCGEAILGSLGVRSPASSPVRSSTQSNGPPFVGRAQQLESLLSAFDSARAGDPVAALVYGESGVGKSAVARRFLSDLSKRFPDCVVLSGRCYEREAVPFKAVDDVLDSLASYLQRLPAAEAATLVPRKAGLLPAAFPVLRRVGVLADAPIVTIADPQENRARVFGALREMLALLCERHPLVISIDDLQWTDADSLALISELLRPPDAPPLLLLATWRTVVENPDDPAFPIPALPGNVRHMHVGPLPDDEARDLAWRIAKMAGGSPIDRGAWDAVVEEAGGHPLFIDELVRHVVLGGGVPERNQADPAHVRLDEALWARVSGLDESSRRLLEVVSIAGFPIPQELAALAADLPLGEVTRNASFLRVANLVCTAGPRRTDTIEPFHDRVREAVVFNMPADAKKAWHRRFAKALLTSAEADPEALAIHFQAAGELETAARYAERGADRAAEGLAFDRAASLYRLALELGKHAPAERRSLLTRFGDALSNAGNGVEAAEAYLSALDGAKESEVLELRRSAAEQLLRSGKIDEGLDQLRAVLQRIGESYPRSPAQALAALVVRRAEIRLRGLGFTERDTSQIPAAELTRIDVCHSVAKLVGVVDTISGALFQTREVLLALRAGEPSRVARALGIEIAYVSIGGGKSARRTQQLIATATEIAERTGDVNAKAIVRMSDALACFLAGRWRQGQLKAEQAESMLRTHCTGSFWERSTTVFIATGALAYLGDIPELAARAFQEWRDAEDRGDLYAALNVCSGSQNIAWLALESPEAARSVTETAIRKWSRSGVHLQHYNDMFAQANIDLFEGKCRDASDRIARAFRLAEEARLLDIQQNRVEMLDLRGRAAIASLADRPSDSRRLIAVATESVDRIRGEHMFWSNPLADRLEACILIARGRDREATTLLRKAVSGFDFAEMGLFSAVTRRCLGRVVGGEEGRRLVGEADAWMVRMGIESPDRFEAMYCPSSLRF